MSGKNNSSGHAWVADGYQTDKIFSSNCNNSWTYLYFHMNWGWNGYLDGYYSFDNWTAGSSSYNDNKKMTYNIKP
ncbi:C10 family peptidase [Sphingobacterium sp. ML3W]|uniref:C10 family peptidase n=1 Tax=Sphingobacterium sp. ML3W TaxID=1538644 RepID=UPI00397A2753